MPLKHFISVNNTYHITYTNIHIPPLPHYVIMAYRYQQKLFQTSLQNLSCTLVHLSFQTKSHHIGWIPDYVRWCQSRDLLLTHNTANHVCRTRSCDTDLKHVTRLMKFWVSEEKALRIDRINDCLSSMGIMKNDSVVFINIIVSSCVIFISVLYWGICLSVNVSEIF